jgi:hypothetical protein
MKKGPFGPFGKRCFQKRARLKHEEPKKGNYSAQQFTAELSRFGEADAYCAEEFQKNRNYSVQFTLASPKGRIVAFWSCRLSD